ncbi:hypothetical protein [Piscibacillus salipiscarius]|uniref:Uncharacterized protein n=1 Tax=Piscibacillus salipiscarius TaxID=299480 RepID=A0ABW5QBS0_9BACI|nr:hypothetical protein [Piscibacillus salipiscarius]
MENEPTVLTKDVQWKINDSKYIIRNVPYLKADYDEEELFDLDVSLTITSLRDLMVENKIPNDVNYEDFADIKLEL